MAPIEGFAGFEPSAMELLAELGGQDAEWFKANKPAYQELVASPCKAFVGAMGEALQNRISPGIVALPRTNGSIGPINNDLRFSPDKSPYKDHVLFRFWEGADKKTAPTLFVRLSKGGIGFATGAVFGDVTRWREAVASPQGAQLEAALSKLERGTRAEVVGRELKRVPAPYPDDHPRRDLLRHKLLQLRWEEKPPRLLGKPDFVDWCAKRLERCAPVHRWLVDSLA